VFCLLRGYVADVPSDVARLILRSPALRASSLHASYVTELPHLVYDEVTIRAEAETEIEMEFP